MADKIIAASLQLDIKGADKLSELNKEVSGVKGNLKDTGTAALKTGKDVDVSTGSFGKLKGQIGALPGPLGAAGDSVKGLGSAFKALLLNPVVLLITLIVGALALLYKAFTSTNEGADKMEQIFSGVGAAIDVIRDRILKVAGAIAKFFSGDFKGALADGRAAVSGIGQEIATEFAAAAQATKVLQDLDDELRNLSVSRAKLNADLAEAKEKMTDTELSANERRKSIATVREAEAKQNAAEIKEAENRLAAIQSKQQSDLSDEDLQEVADQEIKISNLKQQSSTQNRQLDKLDTAITKEEVSKQAEIRKAAIEAQKVQQQNLAEFNNNLRKLEQENLLLTIKDAHEKELQQLYFKYQEEKRINEQALKDRKLSIEQAFQLQDALSTKFVLEQNNLKAKNEADLAKAEADRKQKAEEDKLALEEKNKAKTKEILDGFANAEKQHTKQLEEEKEARIKIAEAEKEGKITALLGYANALNQVSSIIGQNTVFGKAVAVAASLINTYAAIAGQLKAFSGVPVPGYAIAQAIATGLVGLANVKKIISVQVPGGGSGGGGVNPTLPAALAPAAPIAPTASSTGLQQEILNNAKNAAAQPMQAYVVESQGADSKERIERLNRAARLGG